MINAFTLSLLTWMFVAIPLISNSPLRAQEASKYFGESMFRVTSTNRFQQIEDDSSVVCAQRYFTGYELSNNSEWQAAFDTLKRFVERCPHDPNADHAFLQIGSALSRTSGGNTDASRSSYLSWLESVLYLNTIDPEYFCACVTQISGTLQLPHDTTPGNVSRATNITLAVWQWLLQNTSCDTPFLWQDYEQSRQTQRAQWLNNPDAYKLDTTLPTMQQLGLDTLLAKHFLYMGVSEKPGPNIITSVTASPNPLQGGTTLTFGMNQDAYVKIELFDVMGRVPGSGDRGPGFEQFFTAGNHSVAVSLSGLASGTYYARVSTSFGESQTVKLVKE